MMIDAYFFNVFLKKNDGIARRFVFENGYKPAVTKTGNVWEGETVRAGLCGWVTWIATPACAGSQLLERNMLKERRKGSAEGRLAIERNSRRNKALHRSECKYT